MLTYSSLSTRSKKYWNEYTNLMSKNDQYLITWKLKMSHLHNIKNLEKILCFIRLQTEMSFQHKRTALFIFYWLELISFTFFKKDLFFMGNSDPANSTAHQLKPWKGNLSYVLKNFCSKDHAQAYDLQYLFCSI